MAKGCEVRSGVTGGSGPEEGGLWPGRSSGGAGRKERVAGHGESRGSPPWRQKPLLSHSVQESQDTER